MKRLRSQSWRSILVAPGLPLPLRTAVIRNHLPPNSSQVLRVSSTAVSSTYPFRSRPRVFAFGDGGLG